MELDNRIRCPIVWFDLGWAPFRRRVVRFRLGWASSEADRQCRSWACTFGVGSRGSELGELIRGRVAMVGSEWSQLVLGRHVSIRDGTVGFGSPCLDLSHHSWSWIIMFGAKSLRLVFGRQFGRVSSQMNFVRHRRTSCVGSGVWWLPLETDLPVSGAIAHVPNRILCNGAYPFSWKKP